MTMNAARTRSRAGAEQEQSRIGAQAGEKGLRSRAIAGQKKELGRNMVEPKQALSRCWEGAEHQKI